MDCDYPAIPFCLLALWVFRFPNAGKLVTVNYQRQKLLHKSFHHDLPPVGCADTSKISSLLNNFMTKINLLKGNSHDLVRRWMTHFLPSRVQSILANIDAVREDLVRLWKHMKNASASRIMLVIISVKAWRSTQIYRVTCAKKPFMGIKYVVHEICKVFTVALIPIPV